MYTIKHGVTHIYIGMRDADLDPVFFLVVLSQLEVRYSHEGVWISKVLEVGSLVCAASTYVYYDLEAMKAS